MVHAQATPRDVRWCRSGWDGPPTAAPAFQAEDTGTLRRYPGEIRPDDWATDTPRTGPYLGLRLGILAPRIDGDVGSLTPRRAGLTPAIGHRRKSVGRRQAARRRSTS